MRLYWLSLISFGLLFNFHTVKADDTEIYVGSSSNVAPNVIFLFDTSGSMGWAPDGNKHPSAGNSRLEIVRKAALDTLDGVTGINIAVARFDRYSYGGYMSTPMKSIDADGVRANITSVMNGYTANGGTPMTESYHEAAAYLRGDDVKYGKYESCDYWGNNCQTEYYLPEIVDTSTGKYISPINNECQRNHIVVFTDGDASNDISSNSAIQSWFKTFPSSERPSALSTSCSGNGGCADELAYFLYHKDQSTAVDGNQLIQTHAVGGFITGTAQNRLDSMATFGGGVSANAQSYDELRTALTKIFDTISKTAGSFTAPALAVNAFNSLEHLDQLYYSVFKPAEGVGWSGNIKRYRLANDGTVRDMDDQLAIDSNTGFFAPNAASFWTLDEDNPDGDTVGKGGIARRLIKPDDRKIVTYLGSDKNLMDSGNRVAESNSAMTQSLFGVSTSSSNFTKLLQWARGKTYDSNGNATARRAMEDPLHSRPVLLNYGSSTDANGNKVLDSTIFIGTNAGYLHAFNTSLDDPREHFAFVPKELLPNINRYYENSGTKTYGLDGHISYFHNDVNKDSIVENSNGEYVHLYVGMRRGGRNYYALDVTDRDNPKYLWQITGGSGDFTQLGQTWSKMIPAKIKWQGKEKRVLFFGGGYDSNEDDNRSRQAHSMGNAIFMVDEASGQMLWKASSVSGSSLRLTSMTSGIVGDIVPVDDDGDGYVDILYAADLGGRIWRVDILPNSSGASTFAQGGVIADFNGGDVTNNVRFYTTPDVVYTEFGKILSVDPNDSTKTIAQIQGRYQISIGSGFRAHPLNEEAQDYFYVVNDFNISGAPTAYTTLVRTDLANYSSYSSASATQKRNGLYYKLPNDGEKVLTTSITVADTIYFTTYSPVDTSKRSGCEPDAGDARLYMIKPELDPEATERTIETTDLEQSGIAPSPVIVFPPQTGDEDDERKLILIGGEGINVTGSDRALYKTYWREL